MDAQITQLELVSAAHLHFSSLRFSARWLQPDGKLLRPDEPGWANSAAHQRCDSLKDARAHQTSGLPELKRSSWSSCRASTVTI